MSKSLVIVESPAKVKTINKFLGRDFMVKSSIGHIRDLAGRSTTGGKKPAKKTAKKKGGDASTAAFEKLTAKMGVDPNDHWKAHYEIVPGKEKVLKGLKEAAEKADVIYLATDLDREGEAIAWHLREAIGGPKERYKRVTFTEITQRAVKAAFESPGVLNMDRVNAQQARRFLDRVVGFMISPLLWAKIARGLSAGRVQSVAVRLIAEREREIHAFRPEEYWEIFVDLLAREPISLEVVKRAGEAFKPKNQAEADEAVKILRSSPYKVVQVEKKPTKSKASAPFITSTLQQAASVRLGFGVKKTMTLAQQLYEGGYITYMRTDSTNLSVDAVDACRTFVAERFGKQYCPPEPVKYSSKKSAQEAHEAIRPTDVRLLSTALTGLDPAVVRLYDLIWRQFVACQMTQALFDSTAITVESGPFELKVRGRVMTFDGFLKVQPQMKKKDDEAILPDVKEGEVLPLKAVKPSQHFTKPPARFSEASLVRELEKRGIGRPSTYASIISTIQDRGYVRLEKRRFFCLKMGEIVTDRLVENFSDLMDYSFTATMEEDLDKIAEGEADWHSVLDEFYDGFAKKVVHASEAMRENPPIETDIPCPKCKRPMNIRTARTGVFMSCSGYALPPKERCKQTINLIAGDEVEAFGDPESSQASLAEIAAKRRCDKCSTAMDSYLIDEERKLHVCGRTPECHGYFVELGKYRIKGYEGPVIVCDKCGKDMQLKTGRFGKYFSCVGGPECKNTRKLLASGQAAPPAADPIHMKELPCERSDGYFILRDGAAGLFLASSNFPRSRETRKPQVADLIRHKSELDPKFNHLLKAPTKDAEGLPAIIRYSRKTKEHFVMTEKDGKPTDWSLFWNGHAWEAKK